MFRLNSFLAKITPRCAKDAIRPARQLANLAAHDLRRGGLAKLFPLKPQAISFMANDICNSRCKMCLIWEKKKEHELTPTELAQIMREPLFSKVSNVGVTGGEPTLRKDLPDLFRAIIQNGSNIRDLSIITNAIQDNKVIERVIDCNKTCEEAGVGFGVMVSLDGVGEVHDLNRGRPGNFESALKCIERFQAESIPVSFGCTVTKGNVTHVDELMDLAEEKGWYGRFRVAEFIQRLYNDPQTDFIRSFSPRESYHLALFFFRAEHEFESGAPFQKTYRSIRGMLGEGKPRATGCAYHHDTVILTSRGDLHYCSPKSPNLGSILEVGSAAKVFFKNLEKREEIRKTHCDDCIHDYHVPPTFREKVDFYLECKRRKKRYDLEKLVQEAKRQPNAIPLEGAPESKVVLIVGWYGTETAGDKAILWELVRQLQDREKPPERIVVSSLHPFITRYTIQEIGLSGVDYIETFSREFESMCETCDEVAVGGGPLMSIDALNHMLYAIIHCRRRHGITWIAGCGIGPLEGKIYLDTVEQMLRLSNRVELRDQASADRAFKDYSLQANVVPDPATGFVIAHREIARSGTVQCDDLAADYDVACFLREMTSEYAGDLPETEVSSQFARIEQAQFEMIRDLAIAGHSVRLFAMHPFAVGGDDRRLARRIYRRIQNECGPEVAALVSYAKLPMSPLEILAAMAKAKFTVAMRFHSALFAEHMGVRYLALDYTCGGKIHAFLTESGKESRLHSIDSLIEGNVSKQIHQELSTEEISTSTT
jgi:MoaA/NifB/PqqE/SkfB family radical SAM enzyme/polysaccharide pyruvyl transferase WcaK-like protein